MAALSHAQIQALITLLFPSGRVAEISATRLRTILNDINDSMVNQDAASSTPITIDTTPITGGTNGRVLYDNAGTVGELSDVVRSSVATAFSAQQNFAGATLTDAATINWNLAAAQSAKVTLGGSRTFAAPTNLVNGGTYILLVIQDATGSRLITWNSCFKWPSGAAPILSTAANAVDIISFVSDGTNMYGVAQFGFA